MNSYYSSYARKRLKKFREEYPLTQQEMADRCNMEKRNYARKESGECEHIDLDLLPVFAEALDKEPFDFLPAHGARVETIHNNIGGISNEQVTIHGTADEIRKHYDDLIRHYQHATEEEKRLSAEKDNIIREQRMQLEELRKIIEEMKREFGK